MKVVGLDAVERCPAPPARRPSLSATDEFGARVCRRRRCEPSLSREALVGQGDLHWTFIDQVERGRCHLSRRDFPRVACALDLRLCRDLTLLDQRSGPSEPSRSVKR